jgi:hypothetical protein
MRCAIKTCKHNIIVTADFPGVKVHVDELSSARIWQQKWCATLSANVNIAYCLSHQSNYIVCTVRQDDNSSTCTFTTGKSAVTIILCLHVLIAHRIFPTLITNKGWITRRKYLLSVCSNTNVDILEG